MKKIKLVFIVSLLLLVDFASLSTIVGSSKNFQFSWSIGNNKLQSISHDHVNVSSEYEIVVGWLTEPPRVSQLNNVLIEVNQLTNNGNTIIPVDHAEQNLTVIIAKDTFSTSLQSLIASTSESGVYSIPFKPTQTGTYALIINGTLGLSQINKTILLDPVSSLSDNLLYYLVIPIGLISIVGVGVLIFQKKRRK